jgi:hypothetical protein
VDVGGKHRRDKIDCIRHHYDSSKIFVRRYTLFSGVWKPIFRHSARQPWRGPPAGHARIPAGIPEF